MGKKLTQDDFIKLSGDHDIWRYVHVLSWFLISDDEAVYQNNHRLVTQHLATINKYRKRKHNSDKKETPALTGPSASIQASSPPSEAGVMPVESMNAIGAVEVESFSPKTTPLQKSSIFAKKGGGSNNPVNQSFNQRLV